MLSVLTLPLLVWLGQGFALEQCLVAWLAVLSRKQQLSSYALLGFALSEAMGLFCLMITFLILFSMRLHDVTQRPLLLQLHTSPGAGVCLALTIKQRRKKERKEGTYLLLPTFFLSFFFCCCFAFVHIWNNVLNAFLCWLEVWHCLFRTQRTMGMWLTFLCPERFLSHSTQQSIEMWSMKFGWNPNKVS